MISNKTYFSKNLVRTNEPRSEFLWFHHSTNSSCWCYFWRIHYQLLESIFYIQFDLYTCYFCLILSKFCLKLKNFVLPEIDTKFNFYIKLIMIFLLKFTYLLNIFVEGYYYFKIRIKNLRMTTNTIYLKF